MDRRKRLSKFRLDEPMIKHIANIVTTCRIFGSVLLMCFPAFSVEFYIIYIICGFSDMIDGTVARKLGSAGEMGAKLDTAADFVFVTASMVKILPTISIPIWLLMWGAVIAAVKFTGIILGYASKKQFISMHTAANKITGLLMFLLPFTLPFADLRCILIPVCVVATFAAIQEWVYIRKCKNKYADHNLPAVYSLAFL